MKTLFKILGLSFSIIERVSPRGILLLIDNSFIKLESFIKSLKFNFLDNKFSLRGYTLTELSISTSIIAVLAVGGLAVLQKKNDSEKMSVTLANMAKIDTALKSFIRVKGYVPCAARPDLLESNKNFGKSEAMVADATVTPNITLATVYDGFNSTTNPSATRRCVNNGIVNETGAVPVRTLGLADELSYDGWGRKFTYRSASTSGAKDDFQDPNFRGNIAIMDLKGTAKTSINEPPPYNDGAIYALISHGANGKSAAYRRNDSTAPSAAAGIEAKNTDHRMAMYIQNEKTSKFDDIVIFGTNGKLGRQKIAESPIRIPDIACDNAKSVVAGKRNFLDTYAGDTSNAKADTLFKSATLLANLCQNRKRGETTNPSRMQGLKLWLDANDLSTLFTNSDCVTGPNPVDTNTIGCWKDKSGSGNDAKAGVAPAYRTNITNGKPIIRFNGTSSELLFTSLNLGSNFTVLFALKPNSTTPVGIFDSAPGQAAVFRNWSAGSWELWNSAPIISMSLADTNPTIMTFLGSVNPSRALSYYNNGSLITTGTNASTTAIAWGAPRLGTINGGSAGRYDGDIGEIVMYNNVLSNTDRQKAEEYLSDKWGIPLSANTSTCSGGMVFRKSSDDPEGSCRCPAGQVMSEDLATANACYPDVVNNTFGKCITKNAAPSYTSPAGPDKGGMVLWLDANDCTTITLAPMIPSNATTRVSAWADKSGKGNDAVQATAANQPLYVANVLNGKPVLRFASANSQRLDTTNAFDIGRDTTVCVVVNPASTANMVIFDTAGAVQPTFEMTAINNTFRGWTWTAGGGNSGDYTVTAAISTPHILCHVYNNTANVSQGFIDGIGGATVTAPTNNSVSATRRISGHPSAGLWFNGDMAEIIVYSKALSSLERTNVELYLSSKYNIIRYPDDTNTLASPNSGTLAASLKLWLDAEDGSTIYTDSGCGTRAAPWETVGCWKDKSTGANNASQSTDSARPVYATGVLNGSPVLSFNGTSTYLQTPSISFSANSNSIFAVAKAGTSANYTYIVGLSGHDRSLFFGAHNSNFATFYGNTSAWNDVADNAPATNITGSYFVLSAVQNGSDNPFINGVAQTVNANAMSAVNSIVNIGASDQNNQWWQSDIAEVIIYSAALSANERKSIERYLGNKWGIGVQ